MDKILNNFWKLLSRKWYQFSARNTKILKICKIFKPIFSTFYNISQANFGIFITLGCSFSCCSNKFSSFKIFQNFVRNAISPLRIISLKCIYTYFWRFYCLCLQRQQAQTNKTGHEHYRLPNDFLY